MKMKKNILSAILFFAFQYSILACEVCERNQPKLLKGVVHGAGPESNWDYAGMWFMIIISLLTLFFTVKWLIRPGEKNSEHIKYFILK